MELNIKKKELLNCIIKLNNIVNKTTNNDILSHILIENNNNKMKLTATNLETGLICFCECETIESGSITVSANELLSITKNLIDNNYLNIKTDHKKIILKSKSYKAKTNGFFKDDYPLFPEIKNDEKIIISQFLLKEMFKKTMFASSTNENKLFLNSVFIKFIYNKINVVSTDGHRLCYIDKKINISSEKEIEILLPNKTVNELFKLLENTGDIEIIKQEKNILFNFNNKILYYSRLLEQNFPNYEKVIPKDYNYRILLNKEELNNGINLIESYVDDKTKRISFVFEDEQLKIKSVSAIGNAEYKFYVDFNGDCIELSFNSDFIKQFLKVCDEKNIFIDIIDNKNQIVFRQENEKDYIYVTMPMRF